MKFGVNRHTLATLVITVSLSAGLGAVAHAEDCPQEIPAASKDRRAVAKEWFSRAESAEAAGDQIGAVKAYQCSLKMVPHAFTAFNLGRLAERTGDLELALDAFNTYLKLSPEAADRADVEAKVQSLSAKMAAVRQEQRPEPAPPTPPEPTATAPTPPTTPVPDLKPPVTAEAPSENPASPASSHASIGPVPWIIGGVGAAALVTGIILNVSARGKMDDCRKLTDDRNYDAANSACDAAKPRAYASYALFGVTAAAAIAEAAFIVVHTGQTETHISLRFLPGGGTVSSRFTF